MVPLPGRRSDWRNAQSVYKGRVRSKRAGCAGTVKVSSKTAALNDEVLIPDVCSWVQAPFTRGNSGHRQWPAWNRAMPTRDGMSRRVLPMTIQGDSGPRRAANPWPVAFARQGQGRLKVTRGSPRLASVGATVAISTSGSVFS